LPHVRLTKDAPEGGPGNVVHVSRTRAQDLVNAGVAQRILVEQEPKPNRPPRSRRKP